MKADVGVFCELSRLMDCIVMYGWTCVCMYVCMDGSISEPVQIEQTWLTAWLSEKNVWTAPLKAIMETLISMSLRGKKTDNTDSGS